MTKSEEKAKKNLGRYNFLKSKIADSIHKSILNFKPAEPLKRNYQSEIDDMYKEDSKAFNNQVNNA